MPPITEGLHSPRTSGSLSVTPAGLIVGPTASGGTPLTVAAVELAPGISSGGLSGADGIVGFALWDNLSQSDRIGFFDFSTFDDPLDDYVVQFRTEDIPELRGASIDSVVLTYRNLGPVTATCIVSVTSASPSGQSSQILMSQSTQSFGSFIPNTNNFDAKLYQILFPLNPILTGTLINVSFTKSGGSGNLNIIRVKPIIRISTQDII